MKETKLVLCNFTMDANSQALGFAVDWVNALAQHVHTLDVITLTSGACTLAPNVKLHTLNHQSGHYWSTLLKLIKTVRCLHSDQKGDIHYFIHMAYLFAFPLFLLNLFSRRRTYTRLWYAHQATPLLLKIAAQLVDEIVTSTSEGCTLNLPKSKIRVIGQGISVQKFLPVHHTPKQWRTGDPLNILILGRISARKNCLKIIQSLFRPGPVPLTNINIYLIGEPITAHDHLYAEEIANWITKQTGDKPTVHFLGRCPHHQIASRLHNLNIHFSINRNEGSLDKAILELLIARIPLITSCESARSLLATFDQQGIFLADHTTIDDVVPKVLWKLQQGQSIDVTEALHNFIVENHSLDTLPARIFNG